MEELSKTLATGALLTRTEQPSSTSDLQKILESRLSLYRERLGITVEEDRKRTLAQVQEETALEALTVVERVQQILDQETPYLADTSTPSDDTSASHTYDENTPGEVPVIGTRDLALLRTLLSIVFKWGTEPLLARIQPAWPSKSSAAKATGPRIIDLTNTPEDYGVLESTAKRLLGLVFPRGVHGTVPQTFITKTVLSRHTTDLLRPGIALGWLPKSLATESMPVVDELRPLIMRLLTMVPASQTIASLGSIISSAMPIPPHVQKTCASLLSRQLLRSDGVLGLFAAVFGEGDAAHEDPSLEKLEHVSRVLGAVPATVKPEEYFSSVVPRLLHFISSEDNVPGAYRRAAAFSLSRMLASEPPSSHQALISRLAISPLHAPFSASPPSIPDALTPSSALRTLQTFLTNTDPSPPLISMLLSPVIPAIYAILYALDTSRTVDPVLRESVKGLAVSWGRIVGVEEGSAILWACVEAPGDEWTADVAGELKRVEGPEKPSPLAFFTPENLKQAEETGAFSADANMLNLRPDPAHFVGYLQSLDRADLASEIFVRLLEAYRESKNSSDVDPLRTLVYLQLIVQMQSKLGVVGEGKDANASILSRPEHILAFVQHALEDDINAATTSTQNRTERGKPTKGSGGLGMEDLRIVDVADEDEDENVQDGERDSDDENEVPGMEGVSVRPDEEMSVTAVNLLLSVLEVLQHPANPDLSVQTSSTLASIQPLIEHLTKSDSDILRPLAREALMVLTVRAASSSSGARVTAKSKTGSVQDTYQKALKLLQDPILPVRAHGLLLLRQLVSPSSSSSGKGKELSEEVRPLVPAILDIFLQSAQDDDSYVFLNAVQGLSALVDGAGKDVLRSLLRVYAGGADRGGAAMDQREVDLRVRVGEALGQVVKRCGEALPVYADILVPPLFSLVRSSHLPTTLRTSALALLAQCADTSDLALLPYAADLAGAMLDLLQIESVRAPAAPGPPATSPASDKPNAAGQVASDEVRPSSPSMDAEPTSTNAKFPPLRRAALHFLGLLVRAYTRQAYDEAEHGAHEFPVRRAKMTLGYVAATDVDAVVRVMAREVGEAVGTMEEALVWT
ncbi:hypothetical protein EVG20_g6094 [Dentipellis fragilis]|uniref:Uncharacterized protein n=1 Tax=Dentipellis fragilis TaxID=205917 RepID=A0A4Y9YSE2_9AGAM|nr:hypothetical protein EVG20_g6094 [Dentipellis fragilis]